MGVTQNLYLTLQSQDIANNTSNVLVSLTSTQTGSSYNNNIRTGNYWVSANDGPASVYTMSGTLPKDSTVTLVSCVHTIPHNADGTGKVHVWSNMDTGISAGIVYTDQTLTLPTIPRATTPTLSSSTTELGKSVVIYTPGASSGFTHTLTYGYGTLSGTIATGVTSSCTWTLPLSFASQTPSATSGVGTIQCATYSGSTLIGTTNILFYTTVPSSIVPSISNLSVTDPTGCLSKYGSYVQHKSKAKIDVSAAGAYSSSITSVKITANGATYNQNGITTGVLSKTGTNTITATVTDSRGRTASKSVNISVIGYSNPYISKLTGNRCDADGNPTDEGSYANIYYIGGITALNNKNGKRFKLEYKESSATSWTEIVNTTSAYNIDSSSIVACDTDKVYNFKFTVYDDFTSVSHTINISTVFVLMDFLKTGKGIAIGKVAEHDVCLEVALKAAFRKPVWIDDVLEIRDNDENLGVRISRDYEGGRILISSGNSHVNSWRLDSYNGNLRFFTYRESDNSYQAVTLDQSANIWCHSVYANDWFRSQGKTGWYNESYGGGLYMTDTTYIRVYGGKKLSTNTIESGANRLLCGSKNEYTPVLTSCMSNSNGMSGIFGLIDYLGVGGNYEYMHVSCNHAGKAFGINWWLSDTKLKKNIEDTKVESLPIIDQIRFVEFDWKDKEGHVDLGVTANQLEEIIPEAVFEVKQPELSEYESLKNIDSGVMTTYALKAVQELYTIIKEQQKEIEILKTEIEALKGGK